MAWIFTRNQLALRSVRFHWRLAISVALGVATACAVISGALVVGDSMRGSLRSLTIDRLGKIDQMIMPGGFFEVAGIPEKVKSRDIVPIILFDRGVIEAGGNSGQRLRRATSIEVFGIDPSFSLLDAMGVIPQVAIQSDEVILNQVAADELGVGVGDLVTVRLPSEQAVPADSPLGKHDSQTEGIPRLKVAAVIANRGLGRFALHPSQVEPMIAFLNRQTIAQTLQRDGQANVLLASQPTDPALPSDGELDSTWVEQLPLRLADFGLKLERIESQNYFSLSSDRLLLPEQIVAPLRGAFAGDEQPQPVMTYLANAIERLDSDGNATASVPYSTIASIDSSAVLPLAYQFANQQPNASAAIPLVLNDWAAGALQAVIGDRLRVFYYEPEVQSGREVERSFAAVLSAIVPITQPTTPFRRTRAAQFDKPLTPYNDPDLTPSVPGVTDQDSIADWDLPFKLEREIGSEDDRYWANYRLTPKAFIPLAEGQRLFGSRFGKTTSLRFAATSTGDLESVTARVDAVLRPLHEELGWRVIPLRQSQLAASRGTTPFDALFLSLSMFVILAAVLLISLLFRLGMLQRAGEYGLLFASGWNGRDVSRLALREGLSMALPGVAVGLMGGLLYAKAVLAALRSWWVGAVTVPFLEFHFRAQSLLLGAALTLVVSMLTLWLTARRLHQASPQSLLAGRLESTDSVTDRPSQRTKLSNWLSAGLVALGIVALSFGSLGSGLAQAGAFVGAGMLLLLAALVFIHSRLSVPASRRTGESASRYGLVQMAASNLRRNPLRSTLSIALMAIATFLIVSIGAFQLRPTAAGVGGFALLGRTTTPLYRDLNDPAVQAELLGRDRELVANAGFISMRLQSGQDASCNNLYQAESPQVLSVPARLSTTSDRTPFDWIAHAALAPVDASPWHLLDQPASGSADDPIPLVLDQNTAMWSLQMRGGIGEQREFSWNGGEPINFRVVGLLANSVLQGSLLIGEGNFRRAFPDVNGYEFFLIETSRPESVSAVLENRLGDIGMDVADSAQVLSRLMAVQNTYLKTFQSLGALGLLLGTLGLMIAQLRTAIERRGELAVLRAIGFSRYRLGQAVMLETAAMLLLGIGAGVVCAAIAIAPNLLTGQTIPPVAQPLAAVALISAFGMIAGLVTVSRVVRMPLIESIRNG